MRGLSQDWLNTKEVVILPLPSRRGFLIRAFSPSAPPHAARLLVMSLLCSQVHLGGRLKGERPFERSNAVCDETGCWFVFGCRHFFDLAIAQEAR